MKYLASGILALFLLSGCAAYKAEYQKNYNALTNGVNPKLKKEMSPSQSKTASPNDLNDTIKSLQEAGLIVKINSHMNEVFVNPILWNSTTYDKKEMLAKLMAQYCADQKETTTVWIDIKDAYSGKKIAKYSGAWGFKVS